MSVETMRQVIIDKYGPVMRGKKIAEMSDNQILAIYNRMINTTRK